MAYDLILKNGIAMTVSGAEKIDIAVLGEKIVAIGNIPKSEGKKVIDCTGLHILPGVIDSQVHLREPGNDHKEDLATGGMSAIAGG